MTQRKPISPESAKDFRHAEARRPGPPAGIVPTYKVKEQQVRPYDPHGDPQSQRAGKTEHIHFLMDVVPLHGRICTRTIPEAVRQPQALPLELSGETPLLADQPVRFYPYEVGWTNHLLLGDSLPVMNSPLVKQGMAGTMQIIGMDPLRGIRYASNFPPVRNFVANGAHR